jgi:hypothetical protein
MLDVKEVNMMRIKELYCRCRRSKAVRLLRTLLLLPEACGIDIIIQVNSETTKQGSVKEGKSRNKVLSLKCQS